jgi:energy-coupling factor transporter ATP-binding protein EcfA2
MKTSADSTTTRSPDLPLAGEATELAPGHGADPSAYPFPGMRAFQPDESDLFFGQEAQLSKLVELVGRLRFVAVLGESGCGKSSLVKAGLVPLLAGPAEHLGAPRWHVVVSRPGDAPTANLAEELAKLGSEVSKSAEEVLATLQSSSWGLRETVSQAGLPRRHSVLIVVDQFEELFSFSEESAAKRDEAALFVKLLLTAARSNRMSVAAAYDSDEARESGLSSTTASGPEHQSPPAEPTSGGIRVEQSESPTTARSKVKPTPIYVVITMRSEYLGNAALFHGLAEALTEGTLLLPKMTRSQIESAITGPLKRLVGCPSYFVTTTPGPSLSRRGVPLLAEEGLGVVVATTGLMPPITN